MILSVSYLGDLSRVRLAASAVLGFNRVVLERSLNQLLWTPVRGGQPAVPVEAAVTVDDYEFASGQVNHYRARPQVYEDFEDSALQFTVTNGGNAPWFRVNTQRHAGSWSLAAGAITHSQSSDAIVTVPAGATKMQFWYRVSSEPGFDFFRCLVGSTLALEASGEVGWTLSPVFDLAGATTVTFRYITDVIVASGENRAYIDDVIFSGYPDTTASIAPVLDGVWLKSIRHPFLNRKVVVTEFSDVSRGNRGAVFDVKGRSVPVAVSDVRGAQQFTLQVKTETDVEARNMDLILAAGGQMFVHLPAGCPVPGGYVEIGDSTQSRRTRSARSPRRYHDLPCRVVAAPGPQVVGSTMTWGAVLNLYGSWEQLLASNPTWATLLAGVASPDDLVVL